MIKTLAALAATFAIIACGGCVATPGDHAMHKPAQASSVLSTEPMNFSATLTGQGALVATPSPAKAEAKVALDSKAQTIGLDMTVTGIALDQLWDTLVPATIGPIHFHMYASHDHSGDNVSLAVPVPFGPNYVQTPDGFTVSLTDFAYEDAQALTGSTASFEDFVSRLRQGLILLNIHTDAFPDGEIGGTVVAAN